MRRRPVIRSEIASADRILLPLGLLAVSAACWWATIRLPAAMGGMNSGPDMGTMRSTGFALPPFLLAWALMMAAMMLPAVAPVARLYSRAAALGRVAPAAWFVTGYLIVDPPYPHHLLRSFQR